MYCKQCTINWATLHTEVDDWNEEWEEVCPKCKSNLQLTNALLGNTYLRCPLTGIIKCVETSAHLQVLAPTPNFPKKPFVRVEWEAQQAAAEQRRNNLIDNYITNCNTIGKDAAKEIFLSQ